MRSSESLNWDVVIQAVVAAVQSDADLIATLGTVTVTPAEDSVEQAVNTFRYMVISDLEEEVYNPIVLQIEYRARNRATAVVMDKRLRRILDHKTPRVFGGLEMATTYQDSREMADILPGTVRRSLDFRFEPTRTLIV